MRIIDHNSKNIASSFLELTGVYTLRKYTCTIAALHIGRNTCSTLKHIRLFFKKK